MKTIFSINLQISLLWDVSACFLDKEKVSRCFGNVRTGHEMAGDEGLKRDFGNLKESLKQNEREK